MAALVALTLLSGMGNPAQLAGVLKIVVVVLLSAFLAFQLPFFNDAISTLSERWQNAANNEGDVYEILDTRLVKQFEIGIKSAGTVPMLGLGIGAGSNFGAIQSTGKKSFMLGESEWERIVAELGPILGLLFMAMRIAFAGYLIWRAKHALNRHVSLSWLLLPSALPQLVVGSMEQATSLGFLVFSSGLCLVAAQSDGSSRVGRSLL
jgi:hypothetical protein